MEWQQTCQIIPDGVQTLSKMPSKHIEGVYPKYVDYAEGPYIFCGDKKYIDYPLGLGPIILGHAHPVITRAISEQVARGYIYSLPSQLEGKLAQKIIEIIPCAEMVRFLKTGSEATSAAVKIARAFTGRDRILACGYHGWHDWYSGSTPKKRGVPTAVCNLTQQFKYNDLESLRLLLGNKKDCDVAAVIMEPYILEKPKPDYLRQVRQMCDEYKALLIFDEVVTGFRTKKWVAQAMFDVIPDLTCLGKAMANGVPIACVCGKQEYMEVLRGDCFVSSTWGGDLLGVSAALATIEYIEKNGVINHIWQMGERFKNSFNNTANNLGLAEDVKCIGYPPRTFFIFPTGTHKSLFWQECLKGGVFFGYAQFISHAHKLNHIDETCATMRQAMKMVKKYWDEPEKALQGKPAEETFRLIVTKEASNGTKSADGTGRSDSPVVAKSGVADAKNVQNVDGARPIKVSGKS